MAVLDEIINARRRRLEEARKNSPLDQVEAAAARRHERRDFAAAISGKGLSVIAELKLRCSTRAPAKARARVTDSLFYRAWH